MNIYNEILNCMADIEPIAKAEKNDKQNWKFRGIDVIMNAIQPIFVKHGIFVVPEVLEMTREVKASNSGGALLYSLLKIKFTFYADDGSNISAVVIGEGMDSGDKASNKAMSVGLKYALLQVFCIPTDEAKDPDYESHEVVHLQTKSIYPNMAEIIKQSIVLEGYISSGIISGENATKAQKAIDGNYLENINRWIEWAKKQEEGK